MGRFHHCAATARTERQLRVPIDSISPHPRNYRGHPPEQIEQIRASVRQFGQYREVVTSSDSVILCGQGVWEALKAEGHETVETHQMDFAHDDPRAEKLLIADNELSKLAIDDEKALAALLADIQRQEGGLSGTGWDYGALDKLIGTLAAEDFAAGQLPEAANGKEFDEDLDLSNIKRVTCPECGHEFPL